MLKGREAFGSGGLGRNRTADTRIFNALLYRLSYQATLPTGEWQRVLKSVKKRNSRLSEKQRPEPGVGFWDLPPRKWASVAARRSAGVAKMIDGPTPAIPQVPEFPACGPAGNLAVVDALVTQDGPAPASHPGVEKVHQSCANCGTGQAQGGGLKVAENTIRAAHGLEFPSFWVEQGLC